MLHQPGCIEAEDEWTNEQSRWIPEFTKFFDSDWCPATVQMAAELAEEDGMHWKRKQRRLQMEERTATVKGMLLTLREDDMGTQKDNMGNDDPENPEWAVVQSC
jgi:hypothetical protein